MLSPEQWNEALSALMEQARRRPVEIRDNTGAIVATFTAHNLPTRPQDMPRHLRPKQKLSKRTRDAAKRAKLAA